MLSRDFSGKACEGDITRLMTDATDLNSHLATASLLQQ